MYHIPGVVPIHIVIAQISRFVLVPAQLENTPPPGPPNEVR